MPFVATWFPLPITVFDCSKKEHSELSDSISEHRSLRKPIISIAITSVIRINFLPAADGHDGGTGRR
jgi:hypothetical protein